MTQDLFFSFEVAILYNRQIYRRMEQDMIIQNGSVFTEKNTFEPMDILTEGAFISALSPSLKGRPKEEVYDASGCILIPGLVDLHFHGCMGHDLCDHESETLRFIAAYELQHGITAICPATMTLPLEELSLILKSAKAYACEKPSCGVPGADLLGVHLEGPFVSPARKGAQNPAYLKEPDPAFFYDLKAICPELVKIMTLAPELPGAMDLIRRASKDTLISLGHSTACYRQAAEAFQAGACHVTHLFNAMPPFGHRDTGIIGAAFDDPKVHAELICDGIHVSAPMIRAAFRLFSDDRLILISDSMRATGMPGGDYSLGGQSVHVCGKLATLEDGTIAGSVTNLMDCLRYAVLEAGIPLESAVKAAAVNPARELSLSHLHGQIKKGAFANLLVLTPDLQIKQIIFHGRLLP